MRMRVSLALQNISSFEAPNLCILLFFGAPRQAKTVDASLGEALKEAEKYNADRVAAKGCMVALFAKCTSASEDAKAMTAKLKENLATED